MFQDDFCQQVFEVLVEIFRKECQNRLGRGQVSEDCHPGEAVQSLEQLQERRGAMGSDEQGAGGRGRGACHTLAPSFKLSPRSPEALAQTLMPTCLGPPPSSPVASKTDGAA